MSESTDQASTESKFYFARSPFPAAPQADAYCAIGQSDEALRRVRRAIERAEGPAIIVGGPGLGKTLLCNRIAADFRSRFQVALLSDGQIDTNQQLFRAIMFQLGLPYRNLDDGELRLALIEHLRSADSSGNEGTLLIVDEAQSLSVEQLEQVRRLAGIVHDGAPRVRIVLAGASRLDEQLADPTLASFAQQIASRCYLQSFTFNETAQYINEKLRRVGADAKSLISEQAIAGIHSACDGIPRLTNQLMNHVLYFAEHQNVEKIDPQLVQEAWADLQQLPSPSKSHPRPTATAIEFGPLGGDRVNSAASDVSGDDSEVDTSEISSDVSSDASPALTAGPIESRDASVKSTTQRSTVADSCDLATDTQLESKPREVLSHFEAAGGDDASDLSNEDIPATDFSERFQSFMVTTDSGLASADAPELVSACGTESAVRQGGEAIATEGPTKEIVVAEFNGDQQTRDMYGESLNTTATNYQLPVAAAPGCCGDCHGACHASDQTSQTDHDSEPSDFSPDETEPETQSTGATYRDFPVVRLTPSQSSDPSAEECEPVSYKFYQASDSDSDLHTEHETISAFSMPLESDRDGDYDCEPGRSDSTQSVTHDQGTLSDTDLIELHSDSELSDEDTEVHYREPVADETICRSAEESSDEGQLVLNMRQERHNMIARDVESINREAVEVQQIERLNELNAQVSKGHLSHGLPDVHGDIQISDDRDILVIEDEYEYSSAPTSAAAVSQAEKSLADLTMLFSRIRRG